MMKKDLVLFGIQGSGKGTQAKLFLEKHLDYRYLELGHIFRALTSNDNVISQHILERMSAGKLLDNSLACDMFNMYGHLITKQEYMLTDGFPRSLSQMYYFMSKEIQHERDFCGIYFNLDREKALERIKKRAQEQWREDDVLESALRRLDTFEKETMPVINYFKYIGKLITIDADQPVDVVFAEWEQKLQEMENI